MRLTATDVTVPGPSPQHDPLLPPTSLVADPGEVTLVPVGPEGSAREATALALALGGAVRLGGGSVDLWGRERPARPAPARRPRRRRGRHRPGGRPARHRRGARAARPRPPALARHRRPPRPAGARRRRRLGALGHPRPRRPHRDPARRRRPPARRAGARPRRARPARRRPPRWYAAARAQADTVLTVVVLCRPDTIAALAGPSAPTVPNAPTASTEEVPA